jgi:hypothetical protein
MGSYPLLEFRGSVSGISIHHAHVRCAQGEYVSCRRNRGANEMSRNILAVPEFGVCSSKRGFRVISQRHKVCFPRIWGQEQQILLVVTTHRIACGDTKKRTASSKANPKANRPTPLTSVTAQLLAKAYRQIAAKAVAVMSATQIGTTKKIITVAFLSIRSARRLARAPPGSNAAFVHAGFLSRVRLSANAACRSSCACPFITMADIEPISEYIDSVLGLTLSRGPPAPARSIRR